MELHMAELALAEHRRVVEEAARRHAHVDLPYPRRSRVRAAIPSRTAPTWLRQLFATAHPERS